MLWWLLLTCPMVPSTTAWAGALAEMTAPGALAPCAEVPACDARLGEAVADEMRAAAMGAEALGLGMSPAVVRGTGGLLELSAQSLAMPTFAPRGVGVAPAVPRLALGGVTGTRVRVGGGVVLAAAIPTQSSEVGFGTGAHFGVAIGEEGGRRWVGFEADVGLGVVQGQLVDEPRRAANQPPFAGVPIEVTDCGITCLDQVVLGYAGLDTVMAYDIDETTVIGLRLGGAWQTGVLELATTRSRWTWSGIAPRGGVFAAYRPHPRAVLGLAVRVAVLPPPEATIRTRVPWTGGMSFGWRFGEPAPAPLPPPPLVAAPAPAPPAPVAFPKIPVVDHPELQCGPDRLATGAPPPMGLEGWCVRVTDVGEAIRDGLYVRWHDEVRVRVRGTFADGRETGKWTEFDPQGVLTSQGSYVEGQREGVWTTYEGGRAVSEGSYVRGQESGDWQYWYPNGGATTGAWVNGRRNGLWRDYDAQGRVVRDRIYRDDMLQSDSPYEPE